MQISFIVKEEVSKITISASPVAAASSVSGTGSTSLKYGNNKVSIVCKAQNGQKRTYTLNVVRNNPDNGTHVSCGEINQDGKISNADLVLMKKQILKIESLSGSRFAAADINQDQKVSNADLVLLKKHILGIEEIKQQ